MEKDVAAGMPEDEGGSELSTRGLPSLRDLRSYVREVNGFPMLSAEREEHCVRALRELGSIEAAKELVLSHLRLVAKIAREHAGYGLPQEDLIQEGNVGLMLAVKKFEPSHGVRLAAYASVWIRSEIQEYVLSNWRMVKIGSAKGLRKLFFNLRRLQEELHGLPRLRQKTEIAALLRVEEDEVESAVQWFAGGEARLVEPEADQEGHGAAPVLPAPEASRPDRAAEEREREWKLPQKIKLAMDALDPREREVVGARHPASGKASTLGELACRLGVSIERVRQIEAAALKKMRHGPARLSEFLD